MKHRALGQLMAERDTFHQLHGQIRRRRVHAEGDGPRDRGVPEGSDDLRLASKALERGGVFGALLEEDLDRNLLGARQVQRAPDLAKPTISNAGAEPKAIPEDHTLTELLPGHARRLRRHARLRLAHGRGGA